MPGEDVMSWSVSATNNGNSDTSINWLEGQARASVNNSARSLMAAHAKDRNLRNGTIVTAGTANAHTFASGVSYTIVPTGLTVRLKIGPALTNTGAVTLNMDGIGAVAVLDMKGQALVGGEILADAYADFVYNGTNWIWLAPITAPTPASGTNNASIATTAYVNARPAFLATMGGTDQASWPAANWIVGLFTTEVVDIGSKYTVGLNAWQPPAGRVVIGGQGYFSNMEAGSYASIGIFKNAVLFRQMLVPVILTVANLQITTVDDANGTDFYQLFFNPAAVGPGGATLNGSPINSVFYGHMA